MKIAQVTSLQESVPPRFKSGLEFMVSFLTEELVDRGHEVTLFAPADSQTQARLVPLYPQGVSNDPENTQPACYFGFLNLISALNASLEEKFDLIHSHLIVEPAALSRLANTRLVNTYHHSFTRRAGVFYQSPYFSYLKKIYDLRQNIFHVFVSRAQKRNSSAVWPKEYLEGRSFVVYNGISLVDFEYNPNPENYFAYLGYITENKGVHLAIEVAKKAGVKLKVAGAVGDLRSEKFFTEKIKPFLAKGKIEFLGPLGQREKVRLLKNAQAVFIPIQWDEPFGLTMVEAMACGTPVIGLNRASVPEVVADGVTGFVCQDVGEMAVAVSKIDKIERKACRERVEEKFSVQKMTDGYEEVYQKILRSNESEN